MDLGAALLDRRDAVRLHDRVRDGAILDDTAVDEHVLRPTNRTLVAERRNIAVNHQAPSFLAHFDQVGALAEQLKETLAQAGRRRALEQAAPAARQREAHLGIAERHLRHEPGDLRAFLPCPT